MIVLALCWSATAFAQTTGIGGTINSSAVVSGINYGNNQVTVSNPGIFAAGDRALLIQMQGATITETDDANFGTITALNDAGNYEFLTVCEVNGSDIIFTNTILNTYTPGDAVQLVYVPVYQQAQLSTNLFAPAWSGSLGGVLVLEVTDTLFMNNFDIYANNRGFRGGGAVTSGGGCSFVLDNSYYNSSSSTDEKALKGEGIAAYITNKETGRGPQANGGGGGNNHNGGGGGGSNSGTGGAGGQRIKSSSFTCGSVVGVDSKPLTYSNADNRIYMGGGGGAGHGNNTGITGESGTNGGAIVIIRARVLSGNSRAIYAQGQNNNADATNEGGGGGGAGGTVLLDVDVYDGAINLDVSGGDGADSDNFGSSNCNGPGGGGGGGAIWIKGTFAAANIATWNVSGGERGIIESTAQSNCSLGSSNSAVNGTSGTLLQNLVVNESSAAFVACTLLDTELLNFEAEAGATGVELEWLVSSETPGTQYTIQRSADLHHIQHIKTVNGTMESTGASHYNAHDFSPIDGKSYYRLRIEDANGSTSFTGWKYVEFLSVEKPILVYPNPTKGHLSVVCFNAHAKQGRWFLTDVTGNQVQGGALEPAKGQQHLRTDLSHLNKGVYFITIQIGNHPPKTKRIILSR